MAQCSTHHPRPDRQHRTSRPSRPNLFRIPELEALQAAIPPLTRRQVFIALHRLGLFSADEAIAAAATGVVPAALEPTFAALPEPDQTDARVTFAAFQMAYRRDPMTAMIARAAGLSEDDIDAIWTGFTSV
jgi:hypothetical protein